MAESLQAECLRILAADPQPLDSLQVFLRAELPQDQAQVSWALSNLRKSGRVTVVGKNERGANLYVLAQPMAQPDSPPETEIVPDEIESRPAVDTNAAAPSEQAGTLPDLLHGALAQYAREQQAWAKERQELLARIDKLLDERMQQHAGQLAQQAALAETQRILEAAIVRMRSMA